MSTHAVADGLLWALLMLLGPVGTLPLVASLLAWSRRSRLHAGIALAACLMGLLWGLRLAPPTDLSPPDGAAFVRMVLFTGVLASLATATLAWGGALAGPRSPFRHVGAGGALLASVGMLAIVASHALSA